MEKSEQKASLFIVGAPKCGTSSLNYYLEQHPQIHMAPKEMHFFGSDLGIRQEKMSLADYQAKFKNQRAAVLGESSVWYLFSKQAAKEIRAYNPDARVIIMLRNPIEFIESLYAQFVFDGDELEPKLSKAILNENYGRSMNFEQRPSYFEAASFASQILRFYEQFPEAQIKIIELERLKREVETVYKECLDFLNLQSHDVSFEIMNERKPVRSNKIQHILRSKPEGLKMLSKKLLPSKNLRHKLMARLESINKGGQLQRLSPEERKHCYERLQNEMAKLEELLGHSLNSWK